MRTIGLDDHAGVRIGAADDTQRSGFDVKAAQIPLATRWARRRALGIVRSSHLAVVRTATRPSALGGGVQ